jgi:ribosomal protein L32
MPLTRPNLNGPDLRLDEQSFQGLLSAAFTIQEHNDLRKKARLASAGSEARLEAEGTSLCPQCGALKRAEQWRCLNCGAGQFRPGERLQHNWASMWLMSQEQGLWPERAAEVGESTQKASEGTPKAVAPLAIERRTLAPLTSQSASNGLLGSPMAMQTARGTTIPAKIWTETIRDRALQPSVVDDRTLDHPALDDRSLDDPGLGQLDKPEAEDEWTSETSEDFTGENSAPGDADEVVQPLQLSEHADASASEANATSSARRWASLRVMLHVHRADVYLGAAIVVAVLALLWPSASSPRRASLGPVDRALIALGIAEAPAPAVHLQGDPNIEVWVDPHHALYYCPGEEQYSKTADGRFTSQRDAEMDSFEPANRSACE